jgi:hypothetical protein
VSPIEIFLPHLLGDLVPEHGDPSTDSTRIQVTSLSLAVPVETRMQSTGELDLCLPRGRMQTGFSLPHGRLVVHLGGER